MQLPPGPVPHPSRPRSSPRDETPTPDPRPATGLAEVWLLERRANPLGAERLASLRADDGLESRQLTDRETGEPGRWLATRAQESECRGMARRQLAAGEPRLRRSRRRLRLLP